MSKSKKLNKSSHDISSFKDSSYQKLDSSNLHISNSRPSKDNGGTVALPKIIKQGSQLKESSLINQRSSNAINPSTMQGMIQGIGPGGIELNQFFAQTNNILSPPQITTEGNYSMEGGDPAVKALQDLQFLQNQSQIVGEFSPENNNYTILKSKLFNPNIKEDSVGGIYSNRLSSPPGAIMGGDARQNQLSIIGKGAIGSGIDGNKSISQSKHIKGHKIGESNKYNLRGNSQILKNSHNELVRSMKYKKDMCQLKFYQTLTNYQHQPTALQNQSFSYQQQQIFVPQQQQTKGLQEQLKGKRISNSYLSQSNNNNHNNNNSENITMKNEDPYQQQQENYDAPSHQQKQSKQYNQLSEVQNSKHQTSIAHDSNERPVSTQKAPSTLFPQIGNPEAMSKQTVDNPAEHYQFSVGNDQEDVYKTIPAHIQGHSEIQAQFSSGLIANQDANSQANADDKSLTILFSENSRDNIVLKSNIQSTQLNMLANPNSIYIPDIKTNQQKPFYSLNEKGRNMQEIMSQGGESLENTKMVPRGEEAEKALLQNYEQKERKPATQTQGGVRRRQLISIEKVEKKRMQSETIEQKIAKKQDSVNQKIVDAYQLGKQLHSNQAKDAISCQNESKNTQSSSNFIIKQCQFSLRPDSQKQNIRSSIGYNRKGYHFQYGSHDPSISSQNKKRNLIIKDASQYGDGVGTVVVKEEKKRTACQRFLDRGNKPVPPNYEEHDVYPVNSVDPAGKNIQQRNQFEQNPLAANKLNSFNIDDFDEEINGVNLSKLFSVYGPNSTEQKKKNRKKLTYLKGLENIKKEVISSRVRSSGGGEDGAGVGGGVISTKRSLIEDKYQKLSLSNQNLQNMSDDEEDTVFLKLMVNMFSKKKSVKDKIMMDHEINVENLKQEFKRLKMEEFAQSKNEERERLMRERFNICQKLFDKFPQSQLKNFDLILEQKNMTSKEVEKLRTNPFYLALKANKEEREKLKLLGKQLRIQESLIKQDEQMQQANILRDKYKTDIFQHTFVDVEEEENLINSEQIKNKNANNKSILDKPAKDVFTFSNFDFDLPVGYYQSLGDFHIATKNQIALIKSFIQQYWPETKKQKLQYKVAYDKENSCFNVLLLGKNCPLSKCCKMTICFQFTRDVGGKVICMETICGFNPIDQFFIDLDIVNELFSGIVTSPESQRDQSNISAILENLQPKLRKILAQEVSKSVFNGGHKNISLRTMFQNKNLELLDQKKRLNTKQHMMSILLSQLESDLEGGAVNLLQSEQPSQINIKPNERIIEFQGNDLDDEDEEQLQEEEKDNVDNNLSI